MNVLVTGGAGFIGSHLAGRLVADGHRVVVVDNESTGLRANVPSSALYIKGDVSNIDDLAPAFAEGLDAVCHIAGQVSLIRSYTDAAMDLRTNVLGTLNVIQQCVKYRVPRLLYASSMQSYGNTKVVPTPEDTACEPASYYGITKYAAERYVLTTAERPDFMERRSLAFRHISEAFDAVADFSERFAEIVAEHVRPMGFVFHPFPATTCWRAVNDERRYRIVERARPGPECVKLRRNRDLDKRHVGLTGDFLANHIQEPVAEMRVLHVANLVTTLKRNE